MSMNAKANIENRQLLEKTLGENNPFSEKGLHYLACRLGGFKYRKALLNSISLLQQGTMAETVPPFIQSKVAKAFSYKAIPDPAMVIIGTGRRAILGKDGWDEAGYSLLVVPQLPPDFETLSETAKKLCSDRIELRTQQKEACELLMDFFVSLSSVQVDIPVDEILEGTSTISLEKKPKATVLEFKPKISLEKVVKETTTEVVPATAEVVPETEAVKVLATAEEANPKSKKAKKSVKAKTDDSPQP